MTLRDRLRRVAGHPAVHAGVTSVAFLIVYLALALPREVDQLTPAALVRIPVELLLGVAFLLVLPPRIRHAAAAVGGAALGLLTILKVLEAPMGSEVPLTMTAWDLSFLKGLYAATNNLYAASQRSEIRRQIEGDLTGKRKSRR